MAEQADAADSKSADLTVMGVRFPLRAPIFSENAPYADIANKKNRFENPPHMINEEIFEGLGFYWSRIDSDHAPTLSSPLEQAVRKACFHVRKLLAEFVYNTAALEGNTYTYPEVKTLLDGVTVGGHSLSEQSQILNQKESWEVLLSRTENGTFCPDRETFSLLNGIVARGEALYCGTFRDGNVRIGGTDWIPPSPEKLSGIFETGEAILKSLSDPEERALAFFLFAARNKLFWDGNKRTGRLIMNGILLSHGMNAILVPVKRKQEFDETMIRFYDTGDATPAMEFLRTCSLTRRLSRK